MFNNFFRDGGFGMYPTAAFGFFLVVVAVGIAARPERGGYMRLWTALAVATVASGILGTCTGLVNTFRYAARQPDDQGAALIGGAESLNCTVLGLILITLSSIGLIVGAIRALRRPAA
jgi:hypothetical protein